MLNSLTFSAKKDIVVVDAKYLKISHYAKERIIMKTAIITDSNSGISQEQANELGLIVVPMPFLIDGQDYLEGVDLGRDEFYKKLLSGADVSTSQPSSFSVQEIFDNTLKTYDEIVYIPISSALSNSCETAMAIAKNYGGKVQVVDNKRVSVLEKRSAIDALKLAKEGKTAKEIKDWLMSTKDNASIYIMLSTLKYLKKGGRLTPAAALIGTMLSIKPILTIQGGKLDKFAQALGVNLGKRKMLDQVEKELSGRFKDQVEKGKLSVSVAYTYDKARAEDFKNEVEKQFEKYNVKVDFVDELSLPVACHIGENALAIALCETL